jgi:hypothetical protein
MPRRTKHSHPLGSPPDALQQERALPPTPIESTVHKQGPGLPRLPLPG